MSKLNEIIEGLCYTTEVVLQGGSVTPPNQALVFNRQAILGQKVPAVFFMGDRLETPNVDAELAVEKADKAMTTLENAAAYQLYLYLSLLLKDGRNYGNMSVFPNQSAIMNWLANPSHVQISQRAPEIFSQINLINAVLVIGRTGLVTPTQISQPRLIKYSLE